MSRVKVGTLQEAGRRWRRKREQEKAPSPGIAAVDRAIDILLALYRHRQPLGVTEISRELGLYKSTVHRTLATLQRRGFVQKEASSDRYVLGMKLFTLGALVKERTSLAQVAHPFMEQLARWAKETVHLGVLDPDLDAPENLIVLDKVETQQVLTVTPRIGFGSSPHCSAMGKVLLAACPPDFVEEFVRRRGLPRRTPRTITDLERLQQELSQVRQQGYAVDDQEMELGLLCLGAPVYDAQGRVVGAISVSGPVTRMEALGRETVAEKLRQTAAAISAALS